MTPPGAARVQTDGMELTGTGAIAVYALFVALLPITGLISAVRQPRWRWDTAGKSKELWVVLQAVAIVLPFGGGVLGLCYWFLVKPNLKRARQGVGFPGHT